MKQELARRLREQRRVEPLARFDEHGLREGVRLRQVSREERLLNRRQWQGACDESLLGLGRGRRARNGGQLCDGLVLEEMFGRESYALLGGARDYLDAEDRVAAEREEVVVRAYPLNAKHLRPDCGERLFNRVLRFAVGGECRSLRGVRVCGLRCGPRGVRVESQ